MPEDRQGGTQDAHIGITEMRSGPQAHACQTEKPCCPLLKFQGELTKSPEALLGLFFFFFLFLPLSEQTRVTICIRCLRAISFNEPGIRLGGSLLDLQVLSFLRQTTAPAAAGSPLEVLRGKGTRQSLSPGHLGGGCAPTPGTVLSLPLRTGARSPFIPHLFPIYSPQGRALEALSEAKSSRRVSTV